MSEDPIKAQLIEARRAQILDAAAKVFSQKGFHRATTKEIAETAGVSEGTIYNYFGNKEDLLIGMMERVADDMQMEGALDQFLPTDPREALLELLSFRQVFVRQNYGMLQALLSELIVNPELAERYYQRLISPAVELLEHHLQARVDLGQMRAVDLPVLARLVILVNIGLFLGLLFGDPVVEAEWDRLPDVMVDLLYEGMRPTESE